MRYMLGNMYKMELSPIKLCYSFQKGLYCVLVILSE